MWCGEWRHVAHVQVCLLGGSCQACAHDGVRLRQCGSRVDKQQAPINPPINTGCCGRSRCASACRRSIALSAHALGETLRHLLVVGPRPSSQRGTACGCVHPVLQRKMKAAGANGISVSQSEFASIGWQKEVHRIMVFRVVSAHLCLDRRHFRNSAAPWQSEIETRSVDFWREGRA